MRASLLAALLIGIAQAAVGCGYVSSPTPPRSNHSTAPAHAALEVASTKRQNVTLRLGFFLDGAYVPFVLANEAGYYRAAGFNATVKQGTNSSVVGEAVGNGTDLFGAIDGTVAAQLISKGVPIKVVAMFLQVGSHVFIHKPNVILRSPRDLIGKTIISSAGSTPYALLPAVLKKYHMSKKQLTLHMTLPAAQVPAFEKTPNAVLLGTSTGNYPTILKVDPQALALPYAKFGVSPYNIGLVTSVKETIQHPGQVKRFVAASVKGWKAAQRDPQAAVNAAVKAFPKTYPFILKKGLQIALTLLHTPASKGHPLGWMAQSDWERNLALIHEYLGIKKLKPVHDYYTNKFVP